MPVSPTLLFKIVHITKNAIIGHNARINVFQFTLCLKDLLLQVFVLAKLNSEILLFSDFLQVLYSNPSTCGPMDVIYSIIILVNLQPFSVTNICNCTLMSSELKYAMECYLFI